VSEHSGVQGQGPRKGCKGASKESSCQQDRRTDLAAFVFPQKGHYPRTGALILFNKIIIDMVFSQGFFQGLFTQKYLVQCDVWFNASADLFVKTHSCYYSVNLLNEYVIAKCLLGNNLPGTEF
jgi:hypothetical protein